MHFVEDAGLAAALERRRRQWHELDGTARLWARDAKLWTDSGESEWLGWLDVERLGRVTLVDAAGKRVETESASLPRSRSQADQPAKLAEILAGPPFDRCLLLGMGGSALGADLLWGALPSPTDAEFIVLDTTDPREIAAALDGTDPAALRVIAASKSGSTLETRLAFELLLDWLGEAAPQSVLAITDPGSALEARARAAGTRIAFGRPEVGGRFSVLSAFGLAPAAAAGIDPETLLASARAMAAACRDRPSCDDGVASPSSVSSVDKEQRATERRPNPGVELGLLLAAAHDCGRDKLYLHAPDGCAGMIGWVEQLIAESLGKGDVLLLPVAAAGMPAETSANRLDIVLGSGPDQSDDDSASMPDAPAEAHVARLRLEENESDPDVAAAGEKIVSPAGGPCVRIEARLPADLGGEFFRWQFATAVAGALLRINPFDQPDVESSKAVTRRYVERMKAGDAPTARGVIRLSEVSALGLAALLGTHLATFPDRGYAVISAYVERSRRNRELLQALRRRVARCVRGAATLGFGPSFLHSTGQAHKGGPNRGVFLQITADPPAADIPIPNEGLTFGQVQLAQAWGDYEVLVERDRRVLAVHIDGDVEAGLRRLVKAVG